MVRVKYVPFTKSKSKNSQRMSPKKSPIAKVNPNHDMSDSGGEKSDHEVDPAEATTVIEEILSDKDEDVEVEEVLLTPENSPSPVMKSMTVPIIKLTVPELNVANKSKIIRQNKSRSPSVTSQVTPNSKKKSPLKNKKGVDLISDESESEMDNRSLTSTKVTRSGRKIKTPAKVKSYNSDSESEDRTAATKKETRSGRKINTSVKADGSSNSGSADTENLSRSGRKINKVSQYQHTQKLNSKQRVVSSSENEESDGEVRKNPARNKRKSYKAASRDSSSEIELSDKSSQKRKRTSTASSKVAEKKKKTIKIKSSSSSSSSVSESEDDWRVKRQPTITKLSRGRGRPRLNSKPSKPSDKTTIKTAESEKESSPEPIRKKQVDVKKLPEKTMSTGRTASKDLSPAVVAYSTPSKSRGRNAVAENGPSHRLHTLTIDQDEEYIDLQKLYLTKQIELMDHDIYLRKLDALKKERDLSLQASPFTVEFE